ncbi:PhnD/SsuA/transferrin family substrate-binding protein [Dechloromonas denitrificans]|uniref:PhnD/SsuA/transferrin family substrate-binding protein n=1 Tax=Dechloromonas denitrificans TaxID=281362 RepID=UPI001CF9BB48|nr:PhnD/SsuA/transferrin family substrate-binding protein [Dechloromonas denitrificans]UCV06454.1 PhnD/SsuA/transferrin family substrate-binding protein [Dechloromonas denitrificans]
MNKLAHLTCLLGAILLAACEQQPVEKPLQYSSVAPNGTVPVYRLAIHPLYNPQKLSETYQPLVAHLNQQLQGARIELEASRDYAAFEHKYTVREPAFLLPNPWQTLAAMKTGYSVIAMAGDAEDFRGIFIVRKDGQIKVPADLKGKAVSYPSPTALAAAIMPQYFLQTHGVDVKRDIQNIYVGSQESSIINVYLGKTAAGATWPPPWRVFQRDHPREAAELEQAWETPPLLNNSVMVRDDVPEAVRTQVTKTLLELTATAQGRAILAGMETARFHAADDRSYAVVAAYIERFEKEVRRVESK